uniref:Ground-like domain-containing protein n=1 Tax=Elaeophora elaphi TaxID=1147741 RepID=A0A0R3RYW4_9BILA
MAEILYRDIIFIVALYATVNVYIVEGSPCRCSPCHNRCSKSILCPVANICPLQTCPAAPSCPQPAPCPPCINHVIRQPVLVTHQVVVPVVRKIPIIENTCCSTCPIPCVARKKRQSSVEDEMINETTQSPINPICNSKSLQKIMNENITPSLAESQNLIQNVSETQLGGHFNVLCSNNDLSYAAFTTSVFCQHQKYNIICYTFKTPRFQ